MALQPTQPSPGPLSSPAKRGGTPSQNNDKGKKPLHQNRSWVRGRDPEPVESSPTGSDTGRPSLLSRLESPSLLKRIAPPPVEEKPVATSLMDRLVGPPLGPPVEITTEPGEISETEDVEMHDESPAPPPKRIQVKAEETMPILLSPTRRPVGRARGVRSTINVFGEPTGPTNIRPTQSEPGVTVKKEKSPAPEPTPVSESTVEALLATILPANGAATMIHSSPEPMPTPSRSESAAAATADEDVEMASRSSKSAEPITSPSPAASLPSPVLDKCRSLLLPSIVQYALRRNPSLDAKTAEKRALALLSGDKCAEFIKLAKRMRAELDGQQTRLSVPPPDVSYPRSRVELKRPREEDGESEEAKRQRLHSPDKTFDGHRTSELVHTPVPQSSLLGTDNDDLTSLSSRETTRAPASETAANVSPHTSRITTPERTSLAASDIPMSTSGLLPGSIAHLSRATSLVSLHDHPPSGQMHLPLAADSVPLSVRSAQRAPSAGNDQPHTATSQPSPAKALTPRQSPLLTRPSAEHADTSNSLSADPSHHGIVTRPLSASPSNTPASVLPATQETPENDMHIQQDSGSVPQQQFAATLVPALWAAVGGKPISDVEEVRFFVDDATATAARHWACRREKFSFEHQHVKVHLLCLPAAAVAEVNHRLPPDASREDIVTAMWNIKTEWPSRGTLVIHLPSDDSNGPYTPDPDSGPLEITQAIKSGENKLRLIQLADMSSKLFVVHATYPSEDERKKTGSETIALMRTFTKLAPQSFKNSGPLTHRTGVVA